MQLPAFRLAPRSTAARCGRCSARPNEPSFEWSRDLLVGALRPDQEIPVGGCPLPRAQQRDLGVDEASKVCDRQAELPAADSVRRGARPTWIDRGCSAITALRPAYANASIRARTGGPTGHGRPAMVPVATGAHRSPPEARRHCRREPQRASLKSGFAARGIELLQGVDVVPVTTPACRHSAAASALFAPR